MLAITASARKGAGAPMSTLGHKQTFAMQHGMSALPPKADMCSATSDVRFVPIADTAYSIISSARPIRSSGTVMPNARAVLRLTIISTVVER